MTGGTAYCVKSEKTNYGKDNWTVDLYIYVKVVSQSIENNTSTLDLGMYVYSKYEIAWDDFGKNGTSYIGTATSGSNCFTFTADRYGSGTKWLIENKRVTVSHNTDGTLTQPIYWHWGVNSTWGQYVGPSGYKNIKLTDIPRKALITDIAGSFYDTSNPTINYKNPLGNSAAELTACISLDGSKDDIPYRNIPKTGTSYTFNLTDSERTTLRNATVNSRKVVFYIRTKIGSTLYSHSWNKTFTVTGNDATKPSVSMTVSINNSNLPSIFDGIYVQNKSKVNVTISATAKYNASINSYYATIDGNKYTSSTITSYVITSTGNVDIVGYAKDSRGFTGSTIPQTISVVEYLNPAVVNIGSNNAIMCYRSDGDGNRISNSTSVWVKAKRSYSKVIYNGDQKNYCALQYRYKLSTDSWNDSTDLWNDLIASSSTGTDEYNALISGVEFDLKHAYTVQIRAIDTVGEKDIKEFDIPTQDVALHLGEGGKNVSIGTYCDYSKPYSFQSEWDAYFDKNVYVEGASIAPNCFQVTGKSVQAVYQQSITVVSLKIKKPGPYLVLGSIDSTVSDVTSYVNASLSAEGSTFSIAQECRTTMESGGGVMTWGFLWIDNTDTTVSVKSYGYKNGTYNLRGRIIAIRLD